MLWKSGFGEYWRERLEDATVKARVRVESVLFVLFLCGGLVLIRRPNFPIDRSTWWLGFGLFVLIFLVELCFVSAYQHEKDLTEEYQTKLKQVNDENEMSLRKLQSERDSALRELKRQRSAAVQSIIDKSVKLLMDDPAFRNFPLEALQRAGVGDLATENEFDQVRQSVIQHGFTDPLVGLSSLYTNKDSEPNWLEAIKWANTKNVTLKNWTLLIDCIRNSKQPS